MPAEKSYSAFERFLYWFLIPIVFATVLILMLLSLFDYDIKNSMLRAIHHVPVIGAQFPQPAASTKTAAGDTALTAKAQDQSIADLKKKVADRDDLLKKADADAAQKDQTIKDLQAKNADLDAKMKAKALTDQQYLDQVKSTAAIYAQMTPTKAAPVLENLSLKNRILILSQMDPAARVAILEKMDPKKAAEATIALKDVTPVKDQELAALQEQVQSFVDSISASNTKLTPADIGQTFANIAPKSAASLLLDMYGTNADKALQILKATDTASRAKILAAMSDLKADVTANISAKLVP